MKARLWFFGLAGLVALAGGILLGGWLMERAVSHTPDVGPHAFVYPQPRPLPGFHLTSHNEQPFTNEQLQGKWSFLFFGYTYCPDVCPMTLETFNRVFQALKESPKGVNNTQFVFVSVDPERDSLERLSNYVTYFNPEFVGITGNPEELQTLTQAIGIVYTKIQGSSEENYLVDHSSAVLLVGPEGAIHALFSAPHESAKIAEAFFKIRNSRTS